MKQVELLCFQIKKWQFREPGDLVVAYSLLSSKGGKAMGPCEANYPSVTLSVHSVANFSASD